MTTSDTKMLWLDTYRRLCKEAEAMRDSQSVSFALLDLYDTLSSEEKSAVHSILAEWLVSEDNTLRYDAAFLTSQRSIREMRPFVEEAIGKCHDRVGPQAKYEGQKLQRIMDELS